MLTTRRVASIAPSTVPANSLGGGRPIERLGDRHRAQEEIDEMQSRQVGVPVHVSRLAGGYLQQASDLGQPARAQGMAGMKRAVPIRRCSASSSLRHFPESLSAVRIAAAISMPVTRRVPASREPR